MDWALQTAIPPLQNQRIARRPVPMWKKLRGPPEELHKTAEYATAKKVAIIACHPGITKEEVPFTSSKTPDDILEQCLLIPMCSLNFSCLSLWMNQIITCVHTKR